jgi:hypothetical protein
MQTGSKLDLDCAISIIEQAIDLRSENELDRVVRLNTLAVALQKRFELTGSRADLDKTMQLTTEIVTLTPSSIPEHMTFLHNFALVLQR